MRFELNQRYRSSASDVHRAYADPDLYPTLVGLPKLGGIEVLGSQGTPADRLRVRYQFTGHLPAAVTAVVDPARLSWVQESDHDHESLVTEFRLLPEHYPDRLRCQGSFTVTPAGNGCQRVIAGELKVQALLVAGRVEQAIVSGLAEYLEAEAPAVDHWIDERAAR